MSATDTETTTIIRDLGEHGTLEYRETPRSRGYYLAPPGHAQRPKRLVSVTTALQVIAKGRGFDIWQHDQGAGGALEAVRLGELDPAVHANEEAGGVVRELGLGADARRDLAAATGLTIHDALAVYGETFEFPNPADLVIEHRPYMRGLAGAILALDPEPTHVEEVTCHVGLLYGGRFDMRAIIDDRDTLLDLKVRAKPSIRETDCLQLVGYAAAEESLGAPWPERMLAVSVGADGSFITHDVDLPRDSYERVLGLYRLLAEIRKPLDAMRRAAARAAA